MQLFFMIGWRNLWRNKRRSFVVIASISLGVFAILFSIGIMNGMNNQMVENTISTSLGHVSVQHKAFPDDMKLIHSFPLEEDLNAQIVATEHVTASSPRLKLEGMLRSSEASRGVMVMGIDPVSEPGVSDIRNYLLTDQQGSYFDSKPGARQIILSKTIAEKLDLLVGDKVILMFQGADNVLAGFALTIKGLFQSPLDSFDKFVVYLPLSTLMEISGMENRISEIIIKMDNRHHVDTVAQILREKLNTPSLSVLTWKEKAPELFSSVQLFDTMMYLFFSIIFITVVFSVANTLIMAIMERFHEIGVMKSIGTRPSMIAAMVFFESVNLGLVGLATGISFSAAVIGVLSIVGIDFSIFMESVRSFGTGFIIYPLLRGKDILATFQIVMVTMIIAAVYPAVKAAMINPLDALHHI